MPNSDNPSENGSETDTQGPPTPASSTAPVPPKPEEEIPELPIHFAFGPQSWYFVRAGNHFRFVRSQHSVWSDLGIEEAYWVAFKHDTGIFIGGAKGSDGKLTHTWNEGHLIEAGKVDAYVASREAYAKLDTWLRDTTKSYKSSVKKVSITIGPGGSYFARCGHSWTSHNLPTGLKEALDSDSSTPVVVALGVDGAWIVLFADGTRSWDLKYKYPTLSKTSIMNTNDDDAKPIFAALNPFKKDQHFVVTRDATVYYSTSLDDSETGNLWNITNEYAQSQLQLDKTSGPRTVTQTYTSKNGTKRTAVISPEGITVSSGSDWQIKFMWQERRRIMMQKDALQTMGAVGAGAGLLTKLSGASTVRAVSTAGFAGLVAGLFYSEGYLSGYRTRL